MVATAQVVGRKKGAKGGFTSVSLGHGQDALDPANHSLNTNEAGRRDARPTWSPDANDHLVYHWVKFGGKTQELAARLLGISQPTVSRMIDRYERWQAHAEREGGRLDHAERLRAQRWLTYERNELILGSCLRIAAEMEGFTELTKSVVNRPISQFTQETEIRSESATIDRHGVASRFLRLAFRINMEQLKLVAQDPPPLPEPLSDTELAQQEAASAAILAEFEAVERAAAEAAEADRRRTSEEQRVAEEMADQERAAREGEASRGGMERRAAEPRCTAPSEHREAVAECEADGASIQLMNRVNKPCVGKSVASCESDCTCDAESRVQHFAAASGGGSFATAASPG